MPNAPSSVTDDAKFIWAVFATLDRFRMSFRSGANTRASNETMAITTSVASGLISNEPIISAARLHPLMITTVKDDAATFALFANPTINSWKRPSGSSCCVAHDARRNASARSLRALTVTRALSETRIRIDSQSSANLTATRAMANTSAWVRDIERSAITPNESSPSAMASPVRVTTTRKVASITPPRNDAADSSATRPG